MKKTEQEKDVHNFARHFKNDRRKNNGGARKGAGRKEIKDKKLQVILYLKKSKIEAWGGKNQLKEFLYEKIKN